MEYSNPVPAHRERQSFMTMKEFDTATQENHRIQRLKFAEAFLDNVLLEKSIEGHDIDRKNVAEWLETFRKDTHDVGVDFSIDHVWSIAWKRVVELKEKLDNDTVTEFENTKRVWEQITNIQSSDDPL